MKSVKQMINWIREQEVGEHETNEVQECKSLEDLVIRIDEIDNKFKWDELDPKVQEFVRELYGLKIKFGEENTRITYRKHRQYRQCKCVCGRDKE